MNRKHPVMLLGAMCTAALSSGCYDNSRGKNEQIIRVKILDGESGAPVSTVSVHRIRKYSGGFRGSSLMVNSNGLTEFVEAEYFDCTRQSVEFIDPPCSTFEKVDFVTGSQVSFLIEGAEQSDVLDVTLEVGNISTGDSFSIEVVEITEPVFELIYYGL